MPSTKKGETFMVPFEFDDSGIDDLINELDHLSFDIECPECSHSFSISVDDVGKSVICPNCGVSISIESE